eukprot:3390104-Alexandrium_andersonii.AAC.1
MPRSRPADVAALFPALQPSFVHRLGRRLHARGRELLGDQPALDAAAISVSEFAAAEGVDNLTAVRAILEAAFDHLGRLRFTVLVRPDEVAFLVHRFPVELNLPDAPSPPAASRRRQRSRSRMRRRG